MSTVVNLNKARKARDRAAAKAEAAANRIRCGRTKTERELEAARQDQARRELDAKRLDD